MSECRRQIHEGTLPNCIYEDEFEMIGDYLERFVHSVGILDNQ